MTILWSGPISLNSVLTELTMCRFCSHDASAAADPITTSTATIPAPHCIFHPGVITSPALAMFKPSHQRRLADVAFQLHCLSSRKSCPMKSCGMPGAVSRIPIANRVRLRVPRPPVGRIGEIWNSLVAAYLDDVVILDTSDGLPAMAEAPGVESTSDAIEIDCGLLTSSR